MWHYRVLLRSTRFDQDSDPIIRITQNEILCDDTRVKKRLEAKVAEMESRRAPGLPEQINHGDILGSEDIAEPKGER